MRSRVKWLPVVLAALVAVLLWKAAGGPGSAAEPAAAVSPRPPADSTAEPEPSAIRPPLEAAPTSTESERVLEAGQAAGTLSGWVRAPDGSAISAAVVTWTPKSASLQAALDQGQPPAASQIEAATTETSTDSSGHFRLDRADALVPGVLWVTHPGYLASASTLAPEEDSSLEPIELSPAPTFSCTVRRAGEPVEGAQIVHRASASSPDTDSTGADEAALFLRRARSSSSSETPLAPTGLEELLQARTDSELAEPWSGTARRGVELELRPTFFVSGSVTPGARAWTVAPQGHLSLWQQRGLSQVQIWSAPETVGSTFDSVAFPVPSEGSCVLRYEAPGFVPAEALLAGITPGARVTVSLQTEPAARFEVHVSYWESDDIPEFAVEGAEVHCFWRDANGRLVEAISTSDSEGIAAFDNLPSATIACWATKPGMSNYEVSQFALPWQESEPAMIWLTSSGQITGTCTVDGKPAPDFDVRVWSLPAGVKQARLEVRGSENGAFAIDSAPLGEVAIVATSPTGRRSAELNLQLDGDHGSEVELELNELSLVTGRVLLLPSKRPPGAGWVTPLMSAGRTNLTTAHDLTTLGKSFPIGPDGLFAAPCAVPGANTVQIDVPGYSPLIHSFAASTTGVTELGDILLEQRCSVEFTVKTAAGTSPSDFYLYMFGIEAVPFQRVPASGIVRFPSIAASVWNVTLFDRETSVAVSGSFSFAPGGEEFYVLDLSGGTKVTVALTTPGGQAIPEGLVVQVNGRDAQGEPFHAYKPLSGETEVTFEGLAPGSASLLAFMSDGSAPRATLAFTIEPADKELTHTLELSWMPTHCKVVDLTGDPLAGVTVSLLGVPGTSPAYKRVTDSEGRCTFLGIGEEVTEIRLLGPAGEVVEGLPPDLNSGEHELNTLVMDSSRSIVVQFVDSGVPLQDVAAMIRWPLRSSDYSRPKHPDATGIVRFEGLGEGEYELLITAEGRAPVNYMIATSREQQPTQVEVPALVSQAIQVFTSEGDPAGGIQLEFLLQLPETPRPLFSMNLGKWVAAGLASSTPAGITTDGAGRLQLEGIARGGYSWSTAAGSSGFVELMGKPVTIVLP